MPACLASLGFHFLSPHPIPPSSPVTALSRARCPSCGSGDGPPAAEDHGPGGRTPWWLIPLGFLFTFNSGMTVYHPQRDLRSVALAVFSYLDLILLIACLGSYERAAARSSTRQRLKVAVWILTTLLTAAFSYRVAAEISMHYYKNVDLSRLGNRCCPGFPTGNASPGQKGVSFCPGSGNRDRRGPFVPVGNTNRDKRVRQPRW